MRILLIEDEPELAQMLGAELARNDLVVDHVTSIADAREALAMVRYDAILLDRRLPDGDGTALVPALRADHGGTPVIVLSAMGSPADRIDGLDGGADDYLAKPFSVAELLARLRAVLRRPPVMASETLSLANLHYDTASRQVSIDGTPLDLARRELLVLETLLRRAGRSTTRPVLEDAVYGFDDEIASNTLDAHISRLRRKLADAGAGVEIRTIRGIGYLLRALAGGAQ